MRGCFALVAGVAVALAVAAPAGAAAPTFTKKDYPISPKAGQTSVSSDSFAAVDLNNDGKLDIALLDSLPQSGQVSVFLNKGDGTFNSPVQYPTGCSGSADIISGEFDTPADANLDVMIICAPDVIELPGDGTGALGAAKTYTGLGVAGPLTAGVFDRNGHLDLAWDSTGGHDFCYVPVGLLTTTGSNTAICDDPLHTVDSAALLVTPLSEHEDHTPRALAFSHGPGFAGPQTLQVYADTRLDVGHTCCSVSNRAVGGPANALAGGDLNGDGDTDIIMGNGSSPDGSVSVYIWDPATGVPESATPATYNSIVTFGLAVGDFNRDGKNDVVAAGYDNTTNAGELAIHAGNGSGTLQTPPDVLSVPNFSRNAFGGTAVASADFNGDGAQDLAALYGNGVSVFLNTTPPQSNNPGGNNPGGNNPGGNNPGGNQPPFAGLPLKGGTLSVGKNGKFTLTLPCPAASLGNCVGTVTVKTVGKFAPKAATFALSEKKKKRVITVGSAKFSIAPAKSKKVPIKVSKTALKLLKAKKKLTVSEIVVAHDARGVNKRTSTKLTVKRPK